MKVSDHRRRAGRPVLRAAREEGLAALGHHGLRAQPPGRHLRLRRGVLRPDARHASRPTTPPPTSDPAPLRLLGRRRRGLQGPHDALGRQRLLRLLARGAAQHPAGPRPRARRAAALPARGRGPGGVRRFRPGRRRRRHQFAASARSTRTISSRASTCGRTSSPGSARPSRSTRSSISSARRREGIIARALLPVRARPLAPGSSRPTSRPGRTSASTRMDEADDAADDRERVRRGARRPPADRQPLAVAQLPDHHQQDLGEGQRRAGRRRQGDRAFLHRLGHQAGDGGCDCPVRSASHRRVRRKGA